LAAALAGVSCNDGCSGWNAAFERMVNQPKADAYKENKYFSDNRAMRPPPEGAVAQEHTRLAAVGDGSPVPYTGELLARGRNRFDIYCAACHGVLGDSNTVVARNMQLRAPPSLLDQNIRKLTDARIYQVATEGYGLMPGYSYQLSDLERWAVVGYVRALQLSQSIPMLSLPSGLRQEAQSSLPSTQP
jgi:mono/diheme cytochrome c family protein